MFSFSFWFIFDRLCTNHYNVSLVIFFSLLNDHFPLLTTCVHSPAMCISHNESLASCCSWLRFFISSTHHNYYTSITSWFVVDDNFFILGLLYYCWLSFHSLESYLHKVFISLFFNDFLLSFFLWVVSTHAFFCLVLLMDWFLSLIFIYMVFLLYHIQHITLIVSPPHQLWPANQKQSIF